MFFEKSNEMELQGYIAIYVHLVTGHRRTCLVR